MTEAAKSDEAPKTEVPSTDAMMETDKVMIVHESRVRGGYEARIRCQREIIRETKERIRQLRMYQVESKLNTVNVKVSFRKARTAIVKPNGAKFNVVNDIMNNE